MVRSVTTYLCKGHLTILSLADLLGQHLKALDWRLLYQVSIPTDILCRQDIECSTTTVTNKTVRQLLCNV
jgi:hypothetical protein